MEVNYLHAQAALPQLNIPHYPLKRRPREIQSRTGQCGHEKNLKRLRRIKRQFICCTAICQSDTATRLPHPNTNDDDDVDCDDVDDDDDNGNNDVFFQRRHLEFLYSSKRRRTEKQVCLLPGKVVFLFPREVCMALTVDTVAVGNVFIRVFRHSLRNLHI